MIDLLTATQAAAFAALEAGVTLAETYDVIPQDTQPNFVKIGEIKIVNVGSKHAQAERFEVEVQSIYRGKDRTELMAIMHQVRCSLDGQALAAVGVAFGPCEYTGGGISDAAKDGETYAGVGVFEVDAEPA